MPSSLINYPVMLTRSYFLYN